MKYELDLLRVSCRNIGWAVRDVHLGIEVDLGDGAILCFQNADRDADCLIGFSGTPWHAHDHPSFSGAHGYYAEVDYRDLPAALNEGRVLICELESNGRTTDRWLVHRDFNDELKHLEDGERIIVRRAQTRLAAP